MYFCMLNMSYKRHTTTAIVLTFLSIQHHATMSHMGLEVKIFSEDLITHRKEGCMALKVLAIP